MELNSVAWKKATRSNDSGDACIELASDGDVVAIRDSKDSGGPKILIEREDFRHFASVLKSL